MRIGDLYHIVGTLQKHNGAWQISGVTLDNDAQGDKDKTWLSQLSYLLKFDASDPLTETNSNFFDNVTVTSVTREGTTLTFTGTAPNKVRENTSEFTFTVTVPESYNGAIKEGSTLTVSVGYQLETGKITVPSYSNINIK